MPAPARTIRKIAVHCADTPDGMDVGVKEIRQWHKARGFRDVGYHVVVRTDGRVERGREESEIGAHVAGHNSDSLAVCWVGRRKLGGAQKISLIRVIVDWCRRYNLGAKDVWAHHELAPKSGKTCPNLDMAEIRNDVQALLSAVTA